MSSKINKQGYGLARKGHRSAINEGVFRLLGFQDKGRFFHYNDFLMHAVTTGN